MKTVDKIFELFDANGENAYFGENVSQLEHGLQAAHLAEEAGVSGALIVAALLHDIGHLLHGMDERIADRGIDGKHEEVGESWLAGRFPAEVTEPVRLHVAAKRYLCSTDKGYLATLSPASQQSFRLQGGVMSAEEISAFENNPHFREAIQLRYWDDEAKIPNLEVPTLEHYRGYITSALSENTQD